MKIFLDQNSLLLVYLRQIQIYLISLFSYNLTYNELLLFCLVGLLVGMAKVGISGTAMIAVPTLAIIFGGKHSSGVMLIILLMADIFGATYYKSHAQWEHLKRLLPSSILGVILGTLMGEYIDDELFKQIMSVTIFVSVAILLWLERTKKNRIPQGSWFAIMLGVLAGITTMIGNLAGAVMTLYLLAMNMPKNKFIGTAAWFFITINLIKVPFHVFIWKTITLNSFLLDLLLLPLVALGAYVGIRIVRKIPEHLYRYFIITMTIVAAIFMVL